MKKRILVIVDMQNDFLQKDGAMFVEGADTLAARTDKYLSALPPDTYDLVVVVQDTHTSNQIQKTAPHCIVGSRGWQLAIDPILANTDLHFIMKGVNDMWAENNQLARALQIGNGTDVTIIGVAANYCVHDAMLGFLNHGCTVTVLEDLVRGIKTNSTNPARAASGDIRDVVMLEAFRPYTDGGNLKIGNSGVDALKQEHTPSQTETYKRKRM